MTGQIECKYIVNNTFVTFHKYIFILQKKFAN